jgi:uncharacterized DUF497 family protein
MSYASFEWDPLKDKANRAKHGLAFVDAQRAFLDPLRIIAEDLTHSGSERRYFCFGRSEAVSQRSGLRGVADASGYSVPVTGGKGKHL